MDGHAIGAVTLGMRRGAWAELKQIEDGGTVLVHPD